ncbi:MAG: hypothetical protein CM15mV101_140 [uncultured marine virus]|nr:MAG: hypothetical protein CM15mV101_140 [uncultured marine virus]
MNEKTKTLSLVVSVVLKHHQCQKIRKKVSKPIEDRVDNANQHRSTETGQIQRLSEKQYYHSFDALSLVSCSNASN